MEILSADIDLNPSFTLSSDIDLNINNCYLKNDKKNSRKKNEPKDSFNLDLLKDIFRAIEIKIDKKEDLLDLQLQYNYLEKDKFKSEITKLIPKLKKKYKSHNLTCLHKNSIEKQKFPTKNMVRQILKCNNLKLEPKKVYKGNCKLTKKKIFERYFIIQEIK